MSMMFFVKKINYNKGIFKTNQNTSKQSFIFFNYTLFKKKITHILLKTFQIIHLYPTNITFKTLKIITLTKI